MTEFIMLVGIPASGKSSYTKKDEFKNYTIHSSDAIREELCGDVNDQTNNDKVFRTLHSRVIESLKNGENTIYDATNISYKRRMAFLKTIENIPNVNKVCTFFATTYDECLTRNNARDRTIDASVITKMYKNIYIPQYYEGWDYIKIEWSPYHTTDGHNYFDGYSEDALKCIYNPYIDLVKCMHMNHDNPHHKLSIGNHMIKAYNCLSSEIMELSKKDRSILVYATFFHDIGKPFCKEYNDKKGYYTFYQHHLVGAYMSLFYFKYYYNYTDTECLKAVNLIQWHMSPYNYSDMKEQSLEKHREMLGEETAKLLELLHEADLMAH